MRDPGNEVGKTNDEAQRIQHCSDIFPHMTPNASCLRFLPPAIGKLGEGGGKG